MKSFLGYTIAFLVSAFLVSALPLGSPALAGSVSLLTGPTGTNPANNAADQADINAFIGSLNTAIGPTGIFTSGSFGGVFQSNAIPRPTSTAFTIVNGDSLTMGNLRPMQLNSPGSGNTLMKFFLTFTDSQGILSFIPVWQ